MNKIKPFLKWPGGKLRVIDKLRAILPMDYSGKFVDVFMGGGSIFLNISGPTIANDINPDLVQPWLCLQQTPEIFIDLARTLFTPEHDSLQSFLRLRLEFNRRNGDLLRRAALFVYLNRHCYNGLCRYNCQGEFNASYAHDTPKYFPETELRDCLTRVRECDFRTCDFRVLLAGLQAGDVAYCDPPYWPLSATADFNRYHAEHFQRSDHRDLAACAAEAGRRGAIVIVSNHLTDDTRALYHEAVEVQPFEAARAISCKQRRRETEAFFRFGGSPRADFFWLTVAEAADHRPSNRHERSQGSAGRAPTSPRSAGFDGQTSFRSPSRAMPAHHRASNH